jgi:hypothetical protein
MPSVASCHRAGCSTRKGGRGEGRWKTVDWWLPDDTKEKRELWFCSTLHLCEWKDRKNMGEEYKNPAPKPKEIVVKKKVTRVVATNQFAALMDE